jgi:hypothetical protein
VRRTEILGYDAISVLSEIEVRFHFTPAGDSEMFRLPPAKTPRDGIQ